MYRIFVIIIVSACTQNLLAQPTVGATFRTGFNRVGLYFNQTINLKVHNHQVDAGVQYYGPDFVFETNAVGFACAYNYNFLNQKDEKKAFVYFAPGISAAFFKEKKTSSNLYLTELMVNNRMGVTLKQNLSFFSQIGIGAVVNRSTSTALGSLTKISYLNYEIAFGISYFLRASGDN